MSRPVPEVTAAPSSPPSKAQVFFRRLISFLALWTVVIAALFSSNKLLSNYFFLVS